MFSDNGEEEEIRISTESNVIQARKEEDTAKSSKVLDIFSAGCLVLFAIEWCCFSFFTHPDFKIEIELTDDDYPWDDDLSTSMVYRLENPFGFMIAGSIFFALFLCTILYKRKSDGPLSIMINISALVGDIMWFAASIRTSRMISGSRRKRWSFIFTGERETWFVPLTMGGGLLILIFYAYELFQNIFKSSSKSIVKISALTFAFIGTILMVAAGIGEADCVGCRRDWDILNARLFLIGSIFYLVYALLNIALIFVTN